MYLKIKKQETFKSYSQNTFEYALSVHLPGGQLQSGLWFTARQSADVAHGPGPVKRNGKYGKTDGSRGFVIKFNARRLTGIHTLHIAACFV